MGVDGRVIGEVKCTSKVTFFHIPTISPDRPIVKAISGKSAGRAEFD